MWKWFLKQVMDYLVGKNVFGQVQKLVTEVAFDTTMSGAQKRDKVLSEAKNIGEGLATHILNLAIEAAVVLMKEQVTK